MTGKYAANHRDSRTTRRGQRERVMVAIGLVSLLVAASVAYMGSWNDDSGDKTRAALGGHRIPTSSASFSSPSPSPTARTPQPVVLAISVDGLNPDALTTLGRDGAPSFWRLIDEGSSTFNARSSYELTTTLPNHSGMMTGRPVSGPSGTSVTFNTDNGGTLAAVHGDYVPGIFDVAHDRGIPTAILAEKDKFKFLARSWDVTNGAPDSTGPDDGRSKLDIVHIAPSNKLVHDVTRTLTSGDARLVFWHIAAPDVAGHAYGWLSSSYLAAVRDADRQLGFLLAALDADSFLRERTTILLTADHGGSFGLRHHDQQDLVANYRVPFIAWGRHVRPGGSLYAMNPGRKDPGTSRPSYVGAQPIRNFDLADAVLSLLGLPEIPGARASALEQVRLN